MRSLRSSQTLRPSIHELASFLLSPQTQPIHCTTHLTRSLISPSKPRKHIRPFSSTPQWHNSSPKPQTRDRGPPSKEYTQTDFDALDMLGNTMQPSSSIDACLSDGFHLNNGIKITGGDGVLLVDGEAFTWRPWEVIVEGDEKGKGTKKGQKALVNEKGQFEVGEEAWGVLGLVWPKPDLLILGLGPETRPLSPKTRQYLNSLGVRVDISDTRNAAAMFNLLATERGVSSVAAAMVPIG